MTYDYRFFEEHMRRKRTYSGWNLAANRHGDLITFHKDPQAAITCCETIRKTTNILDFSFEDVVRHAGAFSKGGQSMQPLADSLNTEIPPDLRQFYEQHGETIIFTRGMPVWIMPLTEMIELFEDEPDIEITEGRFFRFAKYDCTIYYLGLRRDDQTDKWEVVRCSHGLLYSEMIGPEGREEVVAGSFYEWLKEHIETNGYPDNCAPRDEDQGYSDVLDEGEPE